jgi:hypothetical protein
MNAVPVEIQDRRLGLTGEGEKAATGIRRSGAAAPLAEQALA